MVAAAVIGVAAILGTAGTMAWKYGSAMFLKGESQVVQGVQESNAIETHKRTSAVKNFDANRIRAKAMIKHKKGITNNERLRESFKMFEKKD